MYEDGFLALVSVARDVSGSTEVAQLCRGAQDIRYVCVRVCVRVSRVKFYVNVNVHIYIYM